VSGPKTASINVRMLPETKADADINAYLENARTHGKKAIPKGRGLCVIST
jgi:hypothetical protein